MVSNSINYPIGYVVTDEEIPCIPPFFKVVKEAPTTKLPFIVIGYEKACEVFKCPGYVSLTRKRLPLDRLYTESYGPKCIQDLDKFFNLAVQWHKQDLDRQFTTEYGREMWENYLKEKYPGYASK